MKFDLLMYSRKDCCLCDEMKEVILRVAAGIPLALTEVDVDSVPELRERFGSEVPVLFVNGRKMFKYRVTPRQLRKRLLGSRGFAKILVHTVLGRS
jgi:glutaredoxin